jgi:hypothetical protein
MTLNFTDFGLTSAIDPTDPTKVTADAQLRVSAMADSLGLIANYTQATNANKPLWSRSDNRENLVQYSEELNNAIYTNVNAPVTANAANNPVNGAATADLVVADTVNATHELRQDVAVVSGKTYRISCYAKRNSGTTQFRLVGTALFTNVNFAISGDGTIESTGAGASNVTVTSLTDGWFRLSMTGVATGNGNAQLRLAILNSSGTASFIGDNTGWLMYGAVIQAAGADPTYIPTTDHPQYAGVNGRRWLVLNGAQALQTVSTAANIYANNAKLVYIPIVPFSTGITQRVFTDASGGARYVDICIESTAFIKIKNFTGSYQEAQRAITTNTPQILRLRHDSGNIYAAVDTGSGFVESSPVASGNTSLLTGVMRIGSGESLVNPFYGKIGGIYTANTGLAKPNFENLLREYYFARSQMIWDPYKADLMLKRPTVIG